MTSFQELRDHLNYQIFSIIGSKQFKQLVNQQQQQLSHQFERQPNIIERRSQKNLQVREQLRLNAERYAHTFNILKKNKDFTRLFKDMELLVQLGAFNLNTHAFMVTIQLIGNKQQQSYWSDQVYQGKVIGAYGQTQIGHGSNVQYLQTQAHYNQTNQTFVINSPKNTSIKYWPGLLGTYCTHCVLQARTFVKGKSIGIQTFVLEIRDQNLQPMPGTESGDIGAKLGFKRVDNGYLKITNVPVPRQNMLMKYITVEKDGKVLGLENKQAIKYAYGSMLNLRVKLTNAFAFGYIIRSTTQLHRVLSKEGTEKVQQNKRYIVEGLCCGIGFNLANNHTQALFRNFINNLNQQNYKQADKWLMKCHIVSSTFKALSGWKAISILARNVTINPITTFNVTNLPFSFTQSIPAATYEGDNSVLLQQTARYMLMKQSNQYKQLAKPPSQVNPSDIDGCYKVLDYVVVMEVKKLKKSFEKQSEAGVPFNTVWNQMYQKQIIDAAKLWGVKTLINGLQIFLQDITKHKEFYNKVGKVFTSVLLNDVPQLAFYGFNVLHSEDWNSFSDTELRSILEIGYMLKRSKAYDNQVTKIELLERNKEWIKARL